LKANTTGVQNTATGRSALAANTSGSNNAAFGRYSLFLNTTGTRLTALGAEALQSNTTGIENTAAGSSSLNNNTSGSYNTAVGYTALRGNTTGYENTAIGRGAMYPSTTAYRNVALGFNAGGAMTTGTGNLHVGYRAGQETTSGNWNVYVGPFSVGAGGGTNQEMVIGTNGGSTSVGKGSSTGYINPNGGAMYNGQNSTVWVVASDERLKKNIVDNDVGLSKINAIQVRNFDYRTAEEVESDGVLDSNQAIIKTGTQLGVIAQELELVCPECVSTQDTGVKSVSTENLHWHMLNAIKELSTKNDALEARLTLLEG